MDIAIDILNGAWQTLTEMSPYLLLGFFIAGLLSIFLSTDWVQRHLGGGGTWSVLKASALGVPLPLCSCGVIPVSASLREKGAGKGATTAFLISTPQTGADSIFVTYSLLGPIYAIYRPVLALLSGVIGGILANVVSGDRQDKSPQPDSPDDFQSDCCSTDEGPQTSRLARIWHHGFVELPGDIGKALLIGVAISGVITAVVPNDFFAGALGTGLTGMLVMLAAAVPMYVCATASVPIAAALILKGASPGAALVFLMTGPATNAATIATVWKVMGHRTAAVYLLTMVFCAVAGGLVLDGILPVAEVKNYVPHGQMAIPLWKSISAVLLLALLGWALLSGRIKGLFASSSGTDTCGASDLHTLQVEGMTCHHCVASVTKSLLAVPGVDSADVNLSTGLASIDASGVTLARLRQAVENAGYQVADAGCPYVQD